MNVNFILQRLEKEHGQNWPSAAVDYLLYLADILTLDESESHPDLEDEYTALLTWIRSTIERGVAFRSKV